MSHKLSMKKVKEVMRLKHSGLSHRQIGISINASPSTVSDCLRRARLSGLSWPLDESMSEEALSEKLYAFSVVSKPQEEPTIAWSEVHQEKKRKGVTLQLLWEEEKARSSLPLSYSQYCRRYRLWTEQIDVSLRMTHIYGEKMFVDYSGMKLFIVKDTHTGELQEVEIFVANLGASGYIYTEATLTQGLEDWIGSHVRCLKYFQGSPKIIVPDNLKSGIKQPHLYEPEINGTYLDFTNYYGIAVIPTRVCKPKDKAKVEQAVQHVERQILARLRDRQFFSLYELNQAIWQYLEVINKAPFQKLPGSRYSAFMEFEKPSLMALPQKAYQFRHYKKARVNIDYHIEIEGSYYSVSYVHVKKICDVYFSSTFVEIYLNGKKIAAHARIKKVGQHVTLTEHMPKSHQKYLEWTPSRIIAWAQSAGESVGLVAEKIMETRIHPEQGYRSCLGLIRLGKSYGGERLEAACKRALAINGISYKSVQSILKNRLDEQELPLSDEVSLVTQKNHENIRGKDAYQ